MIIYKHVGEQNTNAVQQNHATGAYVLANDSNSMRSQNPLLIDLNFNKNLSPPLARQNARLLDVHVIVNSIQNKVIRTLKNLNNETSKYKIDGRSFPAR